MSATPPPPPPDAYYVVIFQMRNTEQRIALWAPGPRIEDAKAQGLERLIARGDDPSHYIDAEDPQALPVN